MKNTFVPFTYIDGTSVIKSNNGTEFNIDGPSFTISMLPIKDKEKRLEFMSKVESLFREYGDKDFGFSTSVRLEPLNLWDSNHFFRSDSFDHLDSVQLNNKYSKL